MEQDKYGEPNRREIVWKRQVNVGTKAHHRASYQQLHTREVLLSQIGEVLRYGDLAAMVSRR